MNPEHSGEMTVPGATGPWGYVTHPMTKLLVKGLVFALAALIGVWTAAMVREGNGHQEKTNGQLGAIKKQLDKIVERQDKNDEEIQELKTWRRVHAAEHKAADDERAAEMSQWRQDRDARDKRHASDRNVWLDGMRAIGPKRRR